MPIPVPMPLPPPSRRQFMGQAAALALGAVGFDHAAASHIPHTPRVLTAWNHGSQSWAGLWTPGQKTRGVALPARAHQLLALPAGHGRTAQQALVLARRPGEYILRMDPLRGKALQWHRMEDDRYLGGHAVLGGDGRSFFTTETDGASGQGLIAERDLHTLEKLRDFSSGGIGPHALVQEADGLELAGTLLVANGGILNLPETGRRKLNIGQMDSNLTRLDVRSGAVLAQYRLPDPFLSLRHLAIAPDGTIAAALQAEHPDRLARQTAPALALLHGDTLRTVDLGPTHRPPTWDGYAGDVCWAADRFWVSAPHAGWLLSYTDDGRAQSPADLIGVGALAANSTHWLAAGEHTALLAGGAAIVGTRYPLATPWDNHAVLLA
jgi:hypothetical protein